MHLVNTLENTIDFLDPFYRNQVALVAFTLPQNWQHGSGLSIVATHVDSPNLKVGTFLFSLASPTYSASQDPAHLKAYHIRISSGRCRNIRWWYMAFLARSWSLYRRKSCHFRKVWRVQLEAHKGWSTHPTNPDSRYSSSVSFISCLQKWMIQFLTSGWNGQW